MQLLVTYTRYQDHLGGQLALAEIDERTANHDLEVLKASKQIKSGSDTVTLAKAEANRDPEVRDATRRYDQAYARRKLMKVLYDSMERDGAAVSREITRRCSRENTERRADSFES